MNCPVCIALAVAVDLKPAITVADAHGLAVSVVAHCRMGDTDLCEEHKSEVVTTIARLRRIRIAKEGS